MNSSRLMNISLIATLTWSCAEGVSKGGSTFDPIPREVEEPMVADVPLVTNQTVMAGEMMAGEMMAGEMMADEVMAGEVMAGEMMAGEMMAGEMMAGEVMAGEVMAGEVMAGEVMAGNTLIELDCAGVANGEAVRDMCGVCDDDPNNDCLRDCQGEWGGRSTLDMCGVCDDDPNNDCIQDCSGEWGGERVMSACGECHVLNEPSCATPNIVSDDGHLSGVSAIPLSCIDGLLTVGETMIDCGGVCASCNEIALETLAVRVATYYQAEMFSNVYVMRKIHQIKRQFNLIYVHYSYAAADQPNDELGQDSRIFGLNDQGQIISHAENLSGESQAPRSCGDGRLNMDETGVDCGGSCRPCDQLNRADLGLRIKRFYDFSGEWAGQYVLADLVSIRLLDSTIDALYGYADPDDYSNILGHDSRRFNID